MFDNEEDPTSSIEKCGSCEEDWCYELWRIILLAIDSIIFLLLRFISFFWQRM